MIWSSTKIEWLVASETSNSSKNFIKIGQQLLQFSAKIVELPSFSWEWYRLCYIAILQGTFGQSARLTKCAAPTNALSIWLRCAFGQLRKPNPNTSSQTNPNPNLKPNPIALRDWPNIAWFVKCLSWHQSSWIARMDRHTPGMNVSLISRSTQVNSSSASTFQSLQEIQSWSTFCQNCLVMLRPLHIVRDVCIRDMYRRPSNMNVATLKWHTTECHWWWGIFQGWADEHFFCLFLYWPAFHSQRV